MKKYIKHLFIYLFSVFSVFIILISITSSYVSKKYNHNYSNNEANLIHINEAHNPKIFILGTSHGRQLSRAGYHKTLELFFDAEVLNISQGNGGGGIYNQLFWIKYFEKKKAPIKNKIILYFIDPFVFTTNSYDDNNYIFVKEPFSIDLLKHMIFTGQSLKSIFQYFRSKLGKSYITQTFPTNTLEGRLCFSDSSAVIKRKRNLYPEGHERLKNKSKKHFIKSITKLSEDNTIYLIIPPTYPMGELPLHNELVELLDSISREPKIHFLDHSKIVDDNCLYRDHDHLNKEGIELYETILFEKIIL